MAFETSGLGALDLLDRVDQRRKDVDKLLVDSNRFELGQFMTPSSVAHFMASLFQSLNGDIRLLDPGAGVGSLTSALVDRHWSTISRNILRWLSSTRSSVK
jgi:hypothetical protein